MKIPSFQNAEVSKIKITSYLLSRSHSIGKHKERFFHQFGFSSRNPDILQRALKKHADNDYIRVENTDFGVRYVIEAPLETPDGRNPLIRSVWFMEPNGAFPKLVTAYPVSGD